MSALCACLPENEAINLEMRQLLYAHTHALDANFPETSRGRVVWIGCVGNLQCSAPIHHSAPSFYWQIRICGERFANDVREFLHSHMRARVCGRHAPTRLYPW